MCFYFSPRKNQSALNTCYKGKQHGTPRGKKKIIAEKCNHVFPLNGDDDLVDVAFSLPPSQGPIFSHSTELTN